MPTISVIVPVYNTEKYLHRCIDSILTQTFTDFELLLINDGSMDKSGMICDDYAMKDSRVRVFHKENGGVSSARNFGLDNAKGEWIVFVDSDDWVDNHYLDVLYQDGKYDFVTCYWRIFYNNEVLKGISHANFEYYGINNIRVFLDNNARELLIAVCRLFKKTIIDEKKIRFNLKINYGEDTLFVLSYLVHVQSIKQDNAVLYFYEKHSNSLSTSYVKWEELDKVINIVGDKMLELEQRYLWDGNYMLQYLIWSLFLRKYFTYLQYKVSIYDSKEYLKQVLKNRHVCNIFLPSRNKSISRKIIDYLMRNKMFYLVAVCLKIEHYVFLFKQKLFKYSRYLSSL